MTATITTRPHYLNANTNVYTAWDLRRYMDGDPPGPGVANYESFRVLQTQAGANLGVDIGKTSVGLMEAWVRGSTRGGQGLYRIDNVDTTAPTADTYLTQRNDGVSFTVGDATNPRVDQVILEVLDQQHTGSSNLAQIRVLVGTPTGGATLDNRTGAATLPASCILLADVLMPISQATVVTANIRDRRQFPLIGSVPPLLTAVDQVSFQLAPGLWMQQQLVQSTALMDSNQAAALMYLPRRIASATRMRWHYTQGGTANAGNYVLAIFDATGRKIIDTGAVAYTGALNTTQVRSETITATTFEPGYYYVFIGNGAGTGAASVVGTGANFSCVPASSVPGGVPAVNMTLRAAAGGTTVPTTLLALSDGVALAAGTNALTVPMVTLTVG